MRVTYWGNLHAHILGVRAIICCRRCSAIALTRYMRWKVWTCCWMTALWWRMASSPNRTRGFVCSCWSCWQLSLGLFSTTCDIYSTWCGIILSNDQKSGASSWDAGGITRHLGAPAAPRALAYRRLRGPGVAGTVQVRNPNFHEYQGHGLQLVGGHRRWCGGFDGVPVSYDFGVCCCRGDNNSFTQFHVRSHCQSPPVTQILAPHPLA